MSAESFVKVHLHGPWFAGRGPGCRVVCDCRGATTRGYGALPAPFGAAGVVGVDEMTERDMSARSVTTSSTPKMLTMTIISARVCRWVSLTPAWKATAMIAEEAMEPIEPKVLNRPEAVPICPAGTWW
jgi:hypothetical protein